MHTDSGILYYTARSLSSEANGQSTRGGDATSTRRSHKSYWTTLKYECKTFCCFVCFLTCRSFKFFSPKMYLTLLSMLILAQTMISGGFMAAILKSLQTQFNLSTSKVGFIISSFDIMNVFAVPLVSYAGSRYNKARIISLCSFFYCIGSIVFILPYLVGPRYSVNLLNDNLNETVSQFDYCKSNRSYSDIDEKYGNSTVIQSSLYYTTSLERQDIMNTSMSASSMISLNATTTATKLESSTLTLTSKNKSDNDIKCSRDSNSSWAYAMFIIGQLFMSFGSSPVFSLGITYLCDNLQEKYHAFYTGIIYGAFALGPAIGYLMASFLLSKWVNPTELVPEDFNEQNPRWVGSWWVGFICSGTLVLIFSLLMISFPETMIKNAITLKEKNRLRKAKINEMMIKEGFVVPIVVKPNAKASSILETKLSTIAETVEMDEAKERGQINGEEDEDIDSLSLSTKRSTGCEIPCIASKPPAIEAKSTAASTSSSAARSADAHGSASTSGTVTSTNSSVDTSSEHTFKHRCKHRFNYFLFKLKGFFKSVLKLFLNFRYSLLVLILSIECILLAAFTKYMVVYAQNIYQITGSKASLLVGGVLVPSAVLGAVLGGIIVRKFDLYIEGCTRIVISGSVFVLAGILVLLFIRCESVASTGIDLANQSFNKTFIECNSDCDCQSVYNPVCGADSVSYVSPCYAGCVFGNSSTFVDCTCIKPDVSMNDAAAHTARAGLCPLDCNGKFIMLMIILFFVVTAESLCITPATILLLKLVDRPLQAFALGIMKCFNILIGFIPTPILLSQLIDKSCILWNNECVGDKGTCLEYNSSNFHFTLFGLAAITKVISCILLIVFSIHIHKAYVLKRRYRSHAKLNHDLTSVLSPKERYRIESVVASSESESSSVKSDASSTRGILGLTLKPKPASASSSDPKSTGVVLRRHKMYGDDYSMLEKPTASSSFTNLEQIDNQIKLDDEHEHAARKKRKAKIQQRKRDEINNDQADVSSNQHKHHKHSKNQQSKPAQEQEEQLNPQQINKAFDGGDEKDDIKRRRNSLDDKPNESSAINETTIELENTTQNVQLDDDQTTTF